MKTGERDRVVAWGDELRRVHAQLRKALSLSQDALAVGAPTPDAARDLLLYCHGFCVALTQHHEGEDRELFPAIAAEHPELRDTLRKLEQDHSMIAHLIAGLEAAIDGQASPDAVARHLEGIAAIMESHFRFEEKALLEVLDALSLDSDVERVLGPL
ncbi:hemerythrin domain-containing protein [Microbacterium halophytorum]|uniref:hemerythrin domain-containing protein n=1 Tax=Microbacterium halophytorum TaxID=2067568 RepID=UPI000CFC9978|nr:hemerythrin domain-containing protein [Microbacterium halophytorum]